MALIVLICLAPEASYAAGEGATGTTEGGFRKTDRGATPIEVVVDGKLVRTWQRDELVRLATAKVANRSGLEVPAIPLPTLLFFEGSGLAPEKLVRVTIGGRRRRQDLVLEKDQLASLSHIYIATGRAAFRKPWRVAVDDDADLDLGRRNAQGLTTIEIVTKDASE